MTDRTEELKNKLKEYVSENTFTSDYLYEAVGKLKDRSLTNIYSDVLKAELKGRQEMRDEIRAWVLENWACCGCGLCMNDHRVEIEFDAKFGDKK